MSTDSNFDATFVQSTDGTPIYAEANGNPRNPSIVLVNGLNTSSCCFDVLFTEKRLLDSFYLVRFDLRGSGRSGKPITIEGHASEFYAADFMAVCRHFNLNKPVLLGWSFGVTLAADICAIRPLPISGIIAVAGLAYVGAMPTTVPAAKLGGLHDLCQEDLSLRIKLNVDFVDSLFLEPGKVSMDVKMAFLAPTFQVPTKVFRCYSARPQDPKGLYEAGEQGLPVLFLSGDKDDFLIPSAVVDYYNAHFKNFEYHFLVDGTHALFYEKKEEMLPLLINFSKKVTKAKSTDVPNEGRLSFVSRLWKMFA